MHFVALRTTAALAFVTVSSLPASASHFHRGPTAPKAHHAASKAETPSRGFFGHGHASVTSHPRAIDDARATEIQGALVRAGYLPNASGHWDDSSAEAMRKLQSDNGWQTKLIPDSRALIKLGLGPENTAAAVRPANLSGDQNPE